MLDLLDLEYGDAKELISTFLSPIHGSILGCKEALELLSWRWSGQAEFGCHGQPANNQGMQISVSWATGKRSGHAEFGSHHQKKRGQGKE